jgi:hypothetical protein
MATKATADSNKVGFDGIGLSMYCLISGITIIIVPSSMYILSPRLAC